MMKKFMAGSFALVMVALVIVANPIYLLGCGTCAGTTPPTFSYNEKALQLRMQEYREMDHSYTRENEQGKIDFTIRVEMVEMVALAPTTTRVACSDSPSLVQSAQACSYASSKSIMVLGSFSAIFTPKDGEPRTLHMDEPFSGYFRVEGFDYENGELGATNRYDEESGKTYSFSLYSDTGETEDFELVSFQSEEIDTVSFE